MNLTDALNRISHAVGDGKLVWQQAYVYHDDRSLNATDGKQWARIATDHMVPFCVRYDALKMALKRDGATVAAAPGYGLKVTAGRSRTTIQGLDPETWPQMQRDASVRPTTFVEPPDEFKSVLADLAPFMGRQDNHVWQSGVHLTPDYAFVSNPFAMVRRQWEWQHGLTGTIPAWAVEFVTAQAELFTNMTFNNSVVVFAWPDILLSASLLVEEPPEAAQMMAGGLPTEGGVPVPDNLSDAVNRLASLGAKTFILGDGKIVYNSEPDNNGRVEIEFEEDIDLDGPAQRWGLAPFQAALRHATSLDFSQPARCVWHGEGYDGVFAGMGGGR